MLPAESIARRPTKVAVVAIVAHCCVPADAGAGNLNKS